MKKYVILDIDRTIINGTSWYHACSCPNLLIDEYNIDRFKELNNKIIKCMFMELQKTGMNSENKLSN